MTHKVGSKLLSEFVFTNQIGGMPSPTNITRRRFKPLLEACGYKRNYMRFHDLRGTYVDIMLSQGIQDNYVQKQVGHSKISTTKDVYSNIIPEVNRHAVDILEKVYRKNTKKIRDQNVTKKHP
jgi:integrase